MSGDVHYPHNTKTFDGLKKHQDVTADLNKHKTTISNDQVKAFQNCIKKNTNPFRHYEIDHDHLYNIATCKATSDDVANCLLNIQTIGNNLRGFIDECAQSVTRFEEPVKQKEYFILYQQS